MLSENDKKELLEECKAFWKSESGQEALRKSRDREHSRKRVFKEGEMVEEN